MSTHFFPLFLNPNDQIHGLQTVILFELSFLWSIRPLDSSIY